MVGSLGEKTLDYFERMSKRVPHAKLFFSMLKEAKSSKGLVECTGQLLADDELSTDDKLLVLRAAVTALCDSQDPDSAAQLLDLAESSMDLPLNCYHDLLEVRAPCSLS